MKSAHVLVRREHALAAVHGTHRAGRVNSWLAVRITKRVGSMWTAYLFTLLALLSLPAVVSGVFPSLAGHFPAWLINASLIALVAWIAQTFLQLVLLPIIIVGQNVISAAQDGRAEADHETLTALHALNVQQLKILKLLANPPAAKIAPVVQRKAAKPTTRAKPNGRGRSTSGNPRRARGTSRGR